MPHTDFYSLYVASTASGEPFRMFKDVRIKDFNIVGREEKVGDLVSLEFFPNQPTVPFIEGDFWAEIQEDIPNRALHVKIMTTETEKKDFPYITRLSLFSQNKAHFDIECSPYASATEHLYLQQILQKIRGLDYRRLYIESNGCKKLITSSCPSLYANIDNDRRDLIEQIAQLETKLNTRLTVPLNFDQSILKYVVAIKEKVDNPNEQEKNKCIQEYEKKIFNPKTTLVNVELKAEQSSLIRNLIIHQTGWIKYSSFGGKPIDANKVYEWNQVIKRQGPIKTIANVREFGPVEFFNLLYKKAKESEIFKSIFDLLKVNKDRNLLLKSNIEIEFNEPKNNLQLVNIKITHADDDWNQMESLYKDKNYINLIPILEKFGNDDVTLAYGYVLDHQYDKAIDVANTVIKQDVKSVAHMTKGLAYVGKGDYRKAYEAYLLGVHVCAYDWYPTARENLLDFIKNNNISTSKELTNIEELLGVRRKPLNPNQKCYCGSKKTFKKCHANLKSFSIY